MSVRIATMIVDERTVVQVAGRLQASEVPELNKEVRSIVGPLVLDLSQLLSADKSGIEKLRELLSRGTELRGVSPYLQLLLNDQ